MEMTAAFATTMGGSKVAQIRQIHRVINFLVNFSLAFGIPRIESAGGAMEALMYPTEAVVRRFLAPHETRIAGIYDRAWKKVAALPGRAAMDLKRTVATLMHQFTMNELRREYGSDRGVRLIDEHETIRMMIERRLVVRLKKMDYRGYTRSAPTQAALAFTTPEARLPFAYDDVPDLCAVDVGYVLNDLGTKVEHILAAARDHDAVLWTYEIARAIPTSTASIIPVAPLDSPASIIRISDERRRKKKD